MEKRSEEKIEKWESLRDCAEEIIKRSLDTHFPSQYGHPAPDKAVSKEYQMEMGRALWAYARSDLVIKAIQIKNLKK